MTISISHPTTTGGQGYSLGTTCPHCGHIHPTGGFAGCPRVAAVEYYPDGTLKRVEYHPNPQQIGTGTISITNPQPGWSTLASNLYPAISAGMQGYGKDWVHGSLA